jgi:hypothetical protein
MLSSPISAIASSAIDILLFFVLLELEEVVRQFFPIFLGAFADPW